ncbi:class I tRNA ligase family protein [Candidatus Roizmanbacteria bacterium]|nr:class I tRNA ligase family protein [Candidatus Roizmanbacteria bacterium]
MEPKFKPSLVETKISSFWEASKIFASKVDAAKKPFSIVLPPPNANGSLHLGHALFVFEDVMIRYHLMIGDQVLWLYGTDHAGIETQFVFEKQLRKDGKSRFDFDRETLFKMIWEFVENSRGQMKTQLKRLGFGLDWSREKYTMDKEIVQIVYQTFQRLFEKGLVYRAEKLVNYCTRCGTSFSDFEVNYIERQDPLYFIKYGPFTIATVRPETKFRDTALAVNPKDKRYREFLGKKIKIAGLLGPITMTVIADEEVDPKFGTGIMKVTPAHDPHDFELGKRYGLPVTPIITKQGKMDFSWFLEEKNAAAKYRLRAEKYQGKKVAEARKLMVEDLKEDGLLVKTDESYSHRIGVCYRCASVIEPLPLTQWFIKIRPLADQAKKLVEQEKIKVYPKRFKRRLIQILDNFIDWNISRQIVWGIRIPAYFCQSTKQWFVSSCTAWCVIKKGKK